VTEFLREHSIASLCQELQAQVDAKKTDRHQKKEVEVLLRVLPATSITQIVVSESLRPLVLLMNHESSTAGDPGVRRMYNALPRGYW